MEVTYSVAVDQAIKNLDRYNASITKNESKFKKQSKTEAAMAKKSGIASKAIAAGMAVAATAVTIGLAAIVGGLLLVTAGLYGLMKASSYASIYSTQFGAIIQQVANTFMEKTGLNVVLEDAIRAFQKFADTFGEQGFLVALLGLINEFKAWSWEKWLSFKADPGKILDPIKNIWNVFVDLAKGAWNFLTTDFYPMILSFWDEKLKPAIIWAFEGAWGFIKGLLPQWVVDIIDWAVNLGKAIYEQDWQGVWDSVVAPFEWAWDKFKKTKLGGIIDDLITKTIAKFKEHKETIQETIETLINWAEAGKKIASGILDGIVERVNEFVKNTAKNLGVSIAKKILEGLMHIPLSVTVNVFRKVSSIFGGDNKKNKESVKPYQHGGPVDKTGLALLHAGEYVVPKVGALVAAGGNNNPIINNIEIINNATSISGRLVDDPANVNATSIEEIKNNLQSIVDWIQINVIDKSANWGIQTIANMKNGILSDGMFPYIIPNRIIVGIDNLISLSHSMGLNVITEFKGGINELLDDTTAIIPIGMITAFQQIVDSSYSYGKRIANEIQRGLSSVRLSVTVYKKIVTTSSGGSPSAKYRTGVHDAIIAPGGRIITTDPKDYLIATKNPGELVGGGGSDTYNIAPIINITTGGKDSDIAREVSRAIASEIRRIAKV